MNTHKGFSVKSIQRKITLLRQEYKENVLWHRHFMFAVNLPLVELGWLNKQRDNICLLAFAKLCNRDCDRFLIMNNMKGQQATRHILVPEIQCVRTSFTRVQQKLESAFSLLLSVSSSTGKYGKVEQGRKILAAHEKCPYVLFLGSFPTSFYEIQQ